MTWDVLQKALHLKSKKLTGGGDWAGQAVCRDISRCSLHKKRRGSRDWGGPGRGKMVRYLHLHLSAAL